MSLIHKVNLQTKRSINLNADVGYEFKITGFESGGTIIDMNNYRIVGCHNVPSTSGEFSVTDGWFSPTGAGGTTGSISNNITPTTIYYNSVERPPRRYNTGASDYSGKYNLEINYHLSASGGSATITATNGNWKNFGYRIVRAGGGKNFIDKSPSSDIPFTGQSVLAAGYSYSTNGGYTDNNSFILEYYDSGAWKKVSEVINSAGDADTKTGLYPYDNIYEAAASKEHSLGVDTTYDHKLMIVSGDTYIDKQNTNTNYGTATTFGYKYNVGNNFDKRGMFKFDIANNLSTETIQYVEMWNYIKNNTAVATGTVLECMQLSANWSDTNATFTNASSAFTTSSIDRFNNSTTSNLSLKGYSMFDLPPSLVETWKVEANNYGIGTSLDSTTNPASDTYNTNLLDFTGDQELKPRLIVVFTDTNTGEKIWHGYQSNLWSDSNNWSTSSNIPQPSETAIFDSTVSNNDCLLDVSTSINVLSANAYTGTLNLSSYNLSIATSAIIPDVASLETSASTITFTGTGTAQLSANTLFKLVVNSNTDLDGQVDITNNLNVGPNAIFNLLTSTDYVKLLAGSTSTITGTIDGNGKMYVVDNASLDSGGTLSMNTLNYISSAANVTVRSGDYSGVALVLMTNDDSTPHIFEFEGGIHKYTYLATGLGNNTDVAGTIVSLSANSPSVSASTIDIRNNAVTNHVQFFIGNTDFLCNIFNSNAGTKTISASGGRIILGGEGVVNNFMATSAVIETDLVFKDGPYIFYGTTIPPVMNEAVIKANNITVSGSSTNTPILNFLLVDTLSAVNDIIVSGGPSTFTNLQGSTLAAGNDIKFIGEGNTPSTRLNMDPTSTWYQVAGNKMWAWYADIQNADASGGTSGNAAASINEGGNTNWFFETDIDNLTTEAIVTVDVPSTTATSPITLSFTATDTQTGITSSDISINLSSSTGGIVTSSFNYETANELTFEVEISAFTTSTSFDVTTINGAQLTATDTFGPYTYNAAASTIDFITSTPSYGIKNDEISVLLLANDTFGFSPSGPASVFYGEYNGQVVSFINYSTVETTKAVVIAVLPATTETLSGNLSISATNSIGTTFTSDSSAVGKYYTVDLTPPEVTFLHSPTHQLGSDFVSVSATVTDNVGFTASSFDSLITDYYFVDLNGVTYPTPATSVLSTNKTLLTSTNSLYSGYLSAATYEFEISATGTLYLTLKDLAGNITTCADSGYIVEPAIIFGTPSPSKSTPIGSNIVVPVSALGLFTDNRDNYYAKLLSANNDEVQLSWSNITSAATGVNTFNVTLSGNDQLFGSLVVSGGHD